jgi:hypothetical protein
MTPPAPRGWQKRVALLLFAATTALGVLTVREWSAGAEASRRADALAAVSDWRGAIAQARTAAEALAYGSPWPERGLRRLDAIGHDAEARGDDPTALLAYGAMRTAALETSALGASRERWRRAAEDGVVRVASASKQPPHPRPAAVLEALREDDAPSPWRLALLSVSAFATLGALAALAWLDGPPGVERVAQGVAATGFLVYAAVLWTG